MKENTFVSNLTLDDFMEKDVPMTIQPSMMICNENDSLLIFCSYKLFDKLTKQFPDKIILKGEYEV